MEKETKLIVDPKEINAFRDKFWEISTPFGYVELEKYYSDNLDRWTENALTIRKSEPKKFGLLLKHIYWSNFSYKFMQERHNLFDTKIEYSIRDKVDVIKSCFENSYEFFSVLTLCHIYDSKSEWNQIYKNWHDPGKAKKCNSKEKYWSYNGGFISGKKWALNKCPLFSFSPFDIDALSVIKNASSHEDLLFMESGIRILDDKRGHTDYDEDFIDNMFQFIKCCIALSFQFTLLIAFRKNLWISQGLLILNEKELDLSIIQLPEWTDPLEQKVNNKRTLSSLSFSEPNLQMRLFLLSTMLYVFKDMWEIIKKDEELINNDLEPYGKKINLEKLSKYQIKGFKDTIGVLYDAISKLGDEEIDELIDIDGIQEEQDIEIITNKMFLVILHHLKVVMESGKKKKDLGKLLVFGLLPQVLALLSPISAVLESFKGVLEPVE